MRARARVRVFDWPVNILWDQLILETPAYSIRTGHQCHLLDYYSTRSPAEKHRLCFWKFSENSQRALLPGTACTLTATHRLTENKRKKQACALFLWKVGTSHRRSGFYTVQTVCAIALHLNLALTGDCAFLHPPPPTKIKTHSVCFISVLKSGDVG